MAECFPPPNIMLKLTSQVRLLGPVDSSLWEETETPQRGLTEELSLLLHTFVCYHKIPSLPIQGAFWEHGVTLLRLQDGYGFTLDFHLPEMQE